MNLKRSPFTLLTTLCLSTLLSGAMHSTPIDPLPLWPDGAPESVQFDRDEYDKTTPEDNRVDGRYVSHITNVVNPTLTFYPAPAASNTGTTVLVCPGGGYWILAYNLEGSEVCEWLNSIGVNAVLLKYRVPRREGRAPHEAPLEDAARAMQLIRSKAIEWNLDPTKVGVLGFSAGGHLAATLSNTETFPNIDGVDPLNDIGVRPDFSVLIYPAYLVDEDNGDALHSEVTASEQTPPTFISISMDDPVRVEGSIAYAMALKAAGVPVELHVYPEGGHGYGLRRTANPVTTWPERVEDWMRFAGLLE